MFHSSHLSALIVRLFLLFGFSAVGLCSEPLRITVSESFGTSQHHFQAIAQEIVAIVVAKFAARPPIDAPIQCVWRADVPETLVFPGQITILLSAKDEHWAQLAFQLGHELGHVYLGPLRSNGFIETVAIAMSFEVLDELARRWAIDPVVPGTAPWSVNFSQYRAQYETEEINNFPEVDEAVARKDWTLVRLYLRLRSRDMQQLTRSSAGSQEARALQVLAAMSLRSQPVDWSRLVGVAHSGSTQPTTESSGNVQYTRMRQDAVGRLPDLCRIGLGCPSAFVAAEFYDRSPNSTGVYFQNTWYTMQEVDFKLAQRALSRLCKRRRCLGSVIYW
jgi:hypothetical protein